MRIAHWAALGALLFLMAPPAVAQPAATASGTPRALPIDTRLWTGDFDGMVERRRIRVLVPYSRTLYYNDKGRERGVIADHVRDFERYINKTYAKALGKRPITVYMTPTTRDAMLQHLVEGRGDIVAANLTVTDARQARVDFVAPADQRPVSEVVVTGPQLARDRHGRGPRGQDGPRAPRVELPREPRRAQRSPARGPAGLLRAWSSFPTRSRTRT